MTKTHPALLPNGLEDLLPPHAGHEAAIAKQLMADFTSFGYRRVKAPLAEFEESLLGEQPWSKLAHKTFRVMDPVSNRMLAIRSDSTPQIARMALSRLKDVPRPLRLSYCADILRAQGSQLRPERQYCQAGCEMIGRDGAEADSEMLLVAVYALSRLGVTGLSVDLCMPSLVEVLFEHHGVKGEGEGARAYREALVLRDRDALLVLGGAIANDLVVLLDASGVAAAGLDALLKVGLPESAVIKVQQVRDVLVLIEAALADIGVEGIQFTIDPVEKRGFEYHTGIGYAFFSKGVRGELGRGGRYEAVLGEEHETAVGFTLYLDSLRRACPMGDYVREYVYVPSDMSWSDVVGLQGQGYRVVRGCGEVAASIDVMKRMGCTHMYCDGGVVAI